MTYVEQTQIKKNKIMLKPQNLREIRAKPKDLPRKPKIFDMGTAQKTREVEIAELSTQKPSKESKKKRNEEN